MFYKLKINTPPHYHRVDAFSLYRFLYACFRFSASTFASLMETGLGSALRFRRIPRQSISNCFQMEPLVSFALCMDLFCQLLVKTTGVFNWWARLLLDLFYFWYFIPARWKLGAMATPERACSELWCWLGKRWTQVWALWKHWPHYISKSDIWGAGYWFWNRFVEKKICVYIELMNSKCPFQNNYCNTTPAIFVLFI